MAYKLKKDHVTNWDMQESSDKPLNDDQDTYISERSSATSSRYPTPVPSPKIKRSPTPPPPPHVSPKQSHSLRYYYNELPENGVPLAIQANQAKKEEKQRQKNIRKAPPGQGNLAPVPDTTQPVIADQYFPYWRNYQEKNPDYLMRHRQAADGQLIPYDSFDPTPYVHAPAVTDSTTKPRRRHHRKSRHHRDSSITQYNSDKMVERVPAVDQYVSLKDPDNGDYSDPSNKRTRFPERSKLKTENNQQMTSKSLEDSKTSNNSFSDESKKHLHHHHHHHHHSTPQPQLQKHHHHHHHGHHHHNHHLTSPVKQYVDSEFKVIDASFKKTQRSPYFQEKQKPTHPPPPTIYNQNSFLPPIARDYRSVSLNDYYGTQTFSRDWIKSPKIYKTNPRTNFYDRYLNNVIDKRLTT
jgi:hypothetical protein